jgi:hypothetical protein
LKEAQNNPSFIGNVVKNLLAKDTRISPEVATDIADILTQLIPLLLTGIKV